MELSTDARMAPLSLVAFTNGRPFKLNKRELLFPLRLLKHWRRGEIHLPSLTINQAYLQNKIRRQIEFLSLNVLQVEDQAPGDPPESETKGVSRREYIEQHAAAALGITGRTLISCACVYGTPFDLAIDGKDSYTFNWNTERYRGTCLDHPTLELAQGTLDQILAILQALGVEMRPGRSSNVILGGEDFRIQIQFGYEIDGKSWAVGQQIEHTAISDLP